MSNLPNNWQIKSLGEVLDFHYGKGLSKISREETGEYPVYGSNGVVGCHSNYFVDAPCLIIGRKGSAGEVQYSEKNCWPIDTTYYVKKSENYSLLFFYYLLQKLNLGCLDKSTAIPGLNRNDAYRIKIPFPPLPIQKQIAEILEKADQAKQKRKEANKLTDEFLQSVFIEMFGDPVKNPKGWEKYSLSVICTDIIDCPHSTPNHSNFVTDYPCIRTTEMRNGYIDWSSMKYLDLNEFMVRIKRLEPLEGDIIFAREGIFGEAVRVPSKIKIALGQRTMLFRPDLNRINSEYLWAFVRSQGFYQQAVASNSGSTVAHINVKDIRRFKISLPPLSLQQQFAVIVNKAEALKEKQKQSEQELENLFQSLMQKAFKGELVS